MTRPSRYKDNLPSVTGIVDIIDKPGLRYWYGKYGIQHCEAKKRESQNVGHGVHKAIESFLRGKPFSECSDKLSNDQRVMLSYLVEWCNKKKVKPIAMEESIYSQRHKFAGTPDMICTFNGGKTLTLVDWKTDSMPRDKTEDREREAKYMWQLAGYAIAYEETYKVKINKGYTIRASKDLKFAEYEFKSLKEAKKEFLWLRQIYKKVKGK